MTNPATAGNQSCSDVAVEVERISRALHEGALVRHAVENAGRIAKTLRHIPASHGEKAHSAIIISAGPSVHRQRHIAQVLASGYRGTVIAVDGSFISCLKEGLVPDYVLTLDPHETRIVRWYGDPDFERNSRNDDYFQRQDLDVAFRDNLVAQNLEHIRLVNRYGPQCKVVISSSAPRNVVDRIEEARCESYWWNPLVDDPTKPDSLTRRLYNINRLPCMNTGGNVGTAAWVFASSILRIPTIALLGMDFGYYADLPYSKTQKYYELIQYLGTSEGLDPYFPKYTFPLTGETFYTDATYSWYRKNFLELLVLSTAKTFNCTGGGVLFGEELPCMTLRSFLESVEPHYG